MIIKVKVKPNSRNQSIEQEEELYKINLKERAEEGRANIELLKLLAKHFKVSSSNIRIKSGLTSKNKILEVKNE